MNRLESLRSYTTVVADTGDVDSIERFRPQDATTNPSLILKAAKQERYAPLVERAHGMAAAENVPASQATEAFLDHLFVTFGRAILDIVPGRVSTEVDAALSFDVEATVRKARRLIALYEAEGVDRERILIKVASTWEGIRAAEQLEREGIHCNLTLLFGFVQAVACAEAGITLISPFVGRIYDWYKQDRGVADIPIDEDPGVASVTRIYDYFKKYGYQTQVMGASFRKADQVERLAGCDLLTISPDLLEELENRPGKLEPRLTLANAKKSDLDKISVDEKRFRWLLNDDAMATEKLADGIRRFDADARALAEFVTTQMSS